MVLVSYSGREINAKIVYYGPGLSGKTTNLEYIYSAIPQTHRGKMVSMKTKTERTLFFDFLPIHLGELSGFKTRFLLYTVPGQVYYNATRKLVLKGVDAVVFVADSKRGKMDENIESLENLRTNLKEHGLSLDSIPWCIQYNKRDIPDAHSVEELEKVLNPHGVPSYEAVATTGDGVFETFKAVARMLLKHLSSEIGVKVVPSAEGNIDKIGPQPTPPKTEPKPTEEAPAMPSASPVPRMTSPPTPATAPLRSPQPVAKEPSPAKPVEESSSAREAVTPSPLPRGEAFQTSPPSPEEATETPVKEADEALPSSELEDDTGGERSNGMGDRLRRWFTRPRTESDGETALDGSSDRDETPQTERVIPAVEKKQPASGRPIPLSISGMSPEPESADSVENPASEKAREVPIVVHLDPEDLTNGVVLKVRIAIRRPSESRTDVSTDRDRSVAA